MKSLKFTLLAVLLAGGRATRTLAEDATSIYHSTNSRNEPVTILTDRGESNLNLKELQDFAQVTNADPSVPPALSKNPALVDNASSLPSIPLWHTSWPSTRARMKMSGRTPATSSNQRMHLPGTDNQQNRGSAE